MIYVDRPTHRPIPEHWTNPYRLANMAGVGCPDHAHPAHSEGARFLLSVADSTWDAIQSNDGDTDAVRDGDESHEIADAAPDHGTHTRMKQLVDLAAYDEDWQELTRWSAGADLVEIAGMSLYLVAYRLVHELCDDADTLDGKE